MSEPEEPLTRAIRLSRLRMKRNSRNAVIKAMHKQVEYTNDTLYGMILADASITPEARQRLTLAILRGMAKENEWLFSTEIEQIRKFLGHLELLHQDVREESHELVEIENEFNAIMERTQHLETEPFLRLTKDFNNAKLRLLKLSQRIDKQALNALSIIAQSVNPESYEALFRVLTEDL